MSLRLLSVWRYSETAARKALGSEVSTRVLVRSGTAFEAVYSNWRVSMEAVSSAHSRRCRSSCERYIQEKANANAVMSVVIANTMMALRLMENEFSVLSSQLLVLSFLLRTENWEPRTASTPPPPAPHPQPVHIL